MNDINSIFTKTAALYRKQKQAKMLLNNYSSQMSPNFAKEEREKSLKRLSSFLSGAQVVVEDLFEDLTEVDDTGTDKNLALVFSEAVNKSLEAVKSVDFFATKDLHLAKSFHQDIDSYHAVEVFLALLITLDQMFSLKVAMTEMHPEPLSLLNDKKSEEKELKAIFASIDNLMLEMKKVFDAIDIRRANLTKIFGGLSQSTRPKLMHNYVIDHVGSTKRFILLKKF